MTLSETFLDVLDALGASRYAQHSICLTNDPLMLILYWAGDGGTALAYFIIGACLLASRHRIIYFDSTALTLYGSFIFLCGISHLTSVLVLYSGIYRLDAAVTFAMMAVSLVTAWHTLLNTIRGAGNVGAS